MTREINTETPKRIFLTGATGAMGLASVESLTAAGHQVVGTTRSAAGAEALTVRGATPVVVDLFDERALRVAMAGSDVVAHFATSIPSGFAATRRRSWQTNDRLRRDATAALIAAAEATGVRRFIFESIALAYPDHGHEWIDESQPLDPPSPVMRTALEAERQLTEFDDRGGAAVTLRFGRLYGPGRASADLVTGVRQRSMPIVGPGDNFVSSVHVADVGRAVTAAVEIAPGTYNVADDEPVTQHRLMCALALNLGAPPPRRLPTFLGRVILGHVASVLTVSQRISNRRFRNATGWRPHYPSALDGWQTVTTGQSELETTAA